MSDAECLSAMERTVNAVPVFADLDADRLRPDQVDESQKAVYETTGAVMSGREVRVEDFLSPKEESKSSNYTIVLFLPLDEPFKTHRKINKLKDFFQNRSKLIDIL